MSDYYKTEAISVKDRFFIEHTFIMIACRYIVKRDIIINKNLFFLKNIYHEDEEWTVRLLCSLDKIYALQENIYIYRQRKGSITAKYTEKNMVDIFKILDYLNIFEKSLNNKHKKYFIESRKIKLFLAAVRMGIIGRLIKKKHIMQFIKTAKKHKFISINKSSFI